MAGVAGMFEATTQKVAESHDEVLGVLGRTLSSLTQVAGRTDHARMVALALLQGYFRPGNESVRDSLRDAW